MLPAITFDILLSRTIQFDELIRGLSMEGFTKGEELKECFELVDVDQSGGLEFSEVTAAQLQIGSYLADRRLRSSLP